MTTIPIAPFCFDAVDSLLAEWQWLWQPAPFVETPLWCRQLPALHEALLALDEHEYQRLVGDDSACLDWLCRFLPELAGLRPWRAETAPRHTSLRGFSAGMGARKQGQVSAFVDMVSPRGRRLVEWCAGQGWLLEGLGQRFPERQLEGLEWQPRLCEQGNARLNRAGIAARLQPADVLRDPLSFSTQDSLLALHACGHLHQAMLHQVVQQPVQDLALSPCCYHLGDGKALSQRGRHGRLDATRIDRHLAVQDTGVGHGNRQRRAEKTGQWRLGYDLLRRQLSGEQRYRPTPSWPGPLWQGSFADYCRHCARHHGLPLPGDIDFNHWLEAGITLHRQVRRLELVRRQFRRPLEWWLVLDLGWYLCEQGYRVEIAPFCDRQLTPRNLLILAERPSDVPARPESGDSLPAPQPA